MSKIGILIVLFLILLGPFASAEVQNKQLLILEEIQKSIKKDFNLTHQMKTVISYDTVPAERKEVVKDQKSQGSQKVQELLRKNKMRIQKQQGFASDKPLTLKEKIELMKEKNRQKIKERKTQEKSSKTGKGKDWISSRQNQLNNWTKDKKAEILKWEEEKKKIINKWIAERKKFIKRIPQYKKNLTPIIVPKKATKEAKKLVIKKKTRPKKVEKKEILKMPIFPEYFVVDSAFTSETKDQGKRPTCAAFAGTRAIEILLARKEGYRKLSEQYFFWASKPKCQNSPCSKQGSWVLTEFNKSKQSSSPDIPLDRDCPYSKKGVSGNVTQTPLGGSCQYGKVKVKDFSMVKTMPEILHAIKNNYPVVGAFSLSENFYRNTGYVFMQKVPQVSKNMDSHAAGHAVLLIGHMKLPKKLHATEGTFCLITANSWGIGWGKGGHACLSEKWIEKFRYDVAFVALESIES